MLKISKKLYIIPIISMLVLTGCKSKNEGDSLTEYGTDNAFMMTKSDKYSEESLADVYVKYEGKDVEKIASDIKTENLEYLEGKESILAQDDENNFVKYSIEDEKETIGKSLMEDDPRYSPFKVSPNNETVAYITDDNSLYVKELEKDKDKIDSDVYHCEINNDGKYIYYATEEGDLYLYTEGESDKIASDVYDFKISEDGKEVVFYNMDEDLYIKSVDSEDEEKITSGVVELSSVEFYNDGAVTFLDDFNYNNYKGELYIYKEDEKDKIASDVVQYIRNDDKFYFITEDKTLYEKSLSEDKSNKLLSDVEYIRSSKDGIIYIDEDGDIYSKQGDKDPIKKGKDIMRIELLNVSPKGDIIYLTEDNDLYIGEKIIAKEVENYVYNSEIIAYVTKEKEVHSYNLKNKKDIVEISDAKEYSTVFLENQLLFSNTLEPYELAGFWKMTTESGDIEGIMEFKGNDKIIGHYLDGTKGTSTYSINYSEEDSLGITIQGETAEDEITFAINKDGNMITFEAADASNSYGEKISKSEAGKILKDYHDEIYGDEVEDQDYQSEDQNEEQSEEVDYNLNKSSASSILDDGSSRSYSHKNVMDNDKTTVWSEGVSGPGIGEWIKLSSDEGESNISKIIITNGLATNTDKYYNNNRLKEAMLEFSDGTSTTIYLNDDDLEPQVIDIGNRKTSYVKLTILDVYSSSKYDDTCIAEIEFV